MSVGALTAATVGVALAGASSHAAGATSYCSAARRVDDYHGHDTRRLSSLLERVQQLAPTEISRVVTTMRHAGSASAEFAAARTIWGRYNTNHCCTCIGGSSVPQVVSTAP